MGLIQQVEQFVDRQRTWFELEDVDSNSIQYGSREYGSVFDESPGDEDLREARRLGKEIKKKFKKKVDVELDYVDEWVMLSVTANPRYASSLTQPLSTRPDYGRKSEMKLISVQEMEERLAAKDEKAEDKDSKFEKGKPADPTKNMSPEDKAKWKAQKEKNKDKFKAAKEEEADDKESKFEKGKPADPTKNMSPEDKKKWQAEKEKNKDKFKKADEPRRARFPKGESVDVPEYLREHGNPKAAEEWEAMNEEHGDKFKEASDRRLRLSWEKASDLLSPVEKEAAVAPGGLYGYTKAVQKACESATRKVNKVATKLAKTAYQKDDRVATFLGAHAKRSGSMAAKILVAAMKDIGPKIASKNKIGSGAANAKYLDSLDPRRKAAILEAVAKHYGVSVRDIEAELKDRDAESLYEYLAFDRGMAMQVYRDFTSMRLAVDKQACGCGGSCENCSCQTKEPRSWRGARQTESGFDDKMLLVESYDEEERPVVAAEEPPAPKHAADKEATEYGLYGFAYKTAKLGTESCHSLAHEVGKIAVDLHRRKAALHEQITGFFKNHGRTARCATSKYILACYPDAAAKFGSPKTVQAWLKWDDE
jgi:hypothetical protein